MLESPRLAPIIAPRLMLFRPHILVALIPSYTVNEPFNPICMILYVFSCSHVIGSSSRQPIWLTTAWTIQLVPSTIKMCRSNSQFHYMKHFENKLKHNSVSLGDNLSSSISLDKQSFLHLHQMAGQNQYDSTIFKHKYLCAKHILGLFILNENMFVCQT